MNTLLQKTSGELVDKQLNQIAPYKQGSTDYNALNQRFAGKNGESKNVIDLRQGTEAGKLANIFSTGDSSLDDLRNVAKNTDYSQLDAGQKKHLLTIVSQSMKDFQPDERNTEAYRLHQEIISKLK